MCRFTLIISKRLILDFRCGLEQMSVFVVIFIITIFLLSLFSLLCHRVVRIVGVISLLSCFSCLCHWVVKFRFWTFLLLRGLQWWNADWLSMELFVIATSIIFLWIFLFWNHVLIFSFCLVRNLIRLCHSCWFISFLHKCFHFTNFYRWYVLAFTHHVNCLLAFLRSDLRSNLRSHLFRRWRQNIPIDWLWLHMTKFDHWLWFTDRYMTF